MATNNPSLRIYREVLNADELNFDLIRDRTAGMGVDPDIIRLYDSNPHISIVSPGDLRGFFDRVGINPPVEDVDELGDYLESWLPESASRVLEVPTKPVGEYRAIGKTNTCVFALATKDGVALQERAELRGLAQVFFEVEPGAQEVSPWIEDTYLTKLHIARCSNELAIHAVRTVLEYSSDIFPNTVRFGPVIIEDDETVTN